MTTVIDLARIIALEEWVARIDARLWWFVAAVIVALGGSLLGLAMAHTRRARDLASALALANESQKDLTARIAKLEGKP